MNDDKGEGVAIASLIGTDGYSIVGWVYRWNTSELSVMWKAKGPLPIFKVRPDLNAEQKREIDFDALTQIQSPKDP